jgi:transmembrane sensor
MDNNRVLELFERYHKGLASKSETDELMLMLKSLPDEKLSDILLQAWNQQNSTSIFFTPDTREKFLKSLHGGKEWGAEIHHLSSKRRSSFLKIAAAAVILLVLSSTAFFFLGRDNKDIARKERTHPVANDVAPGGDKAILTLADGRQIVLDTVSNGYLARQGTVKVTKMGGRLSYSVATIGSEKVLYNTIITPKGGQYQLVLADGTQVWLNAASSLRFPTSFVQKERRVVVSGEAYFEVAKNKERPFVVSVNNAEVQVLGTHFNVMAYKEEGIVKTTLLEGSVRFASENNIRVLKPGQQSQLLNDGQVKVLSGVDINEVMAWKNGIFHFQNADITTVMRQVSRWYDVDVVYQTKQEIKDLFVGETPRSSKLSDVLKILELTGHVKFRIQGKKIIVSQ